MNFSKKAINLLVIVGVFAAIAILKTESLPTVQNAAQDTTPKACIAAAFKDYNKANLALLTGRIPLMSVESTISQRRLQEQYCLRLARCVIGDLDNPSLNLPYLAEFSSCLREESLEKYDAVPRTND
jgi:hypothetical protein